MAQRQDLELEGRSIAERRTDGQDQRNNDGSHRRPQSVDDGKVKISKKMRSSIDIGERTGCLTPEAYNSLCERRPILRYGMSGEANGGQGL
jgi:hypothetical protein